MIGPCGPFIRAPAKLIAGASLAMLVTLLSLGLASDVPPPNRGPGLPSAVTRFDDDLVVERAAALAPAPAPPDPSPAPSPSAAAPVPGPYPTELAIQSLGIDGQVLPVGVDKHGNMNVTSTAFTAGWYHLGPAPAQGGDAVVTCHNEWYSVVRALCYNLGKIAVGADITVKDGFGVLHQFKVDEVQTVPYNASVPGLFATTGPPRLSLITCGGTWDKAKQSFTLRVIVDAHLVGNA